MRILVVRTDKIGDLVTATPLLRVLKSHEPDAEITVLASPYAAPLLLHNPFVHATWTDDPAGADGGVAGFRRQIRRVRAERFDISLIVFPTARLDWMTLLAGIRQRIASSVRVSHYLTGAKIVPHHKSREGRHESDYALDLARALGVPIRGTILPEVFVTEQERAEAGALLREAGVERAPVVIHPLSGGSSHNLSPAGYREVAARLTATGESVVVTGGSAERAEIQDLFGHDPVHHLAGRLTLRQLIAVLASAAVFIGGSTGPMHLASAVGTPVVSPFCRRPVLHPRRWGPLEPRSRVLTFPEGDCPRCDGGADGGCRLPGMRWERVVEAALEILAGRRDESFG